MDDLKKAKEENLSETIKTDRKPVPKTKEYILRAARNYRNRRKAIDTEYKDKLNEFTRIYKEKNRDKVNEYHRNYMREYRAKKKAMAATTTTNATPEQQEPIAKQAECNGAESIEAAIDALEALALCQA
jgi:hypothetical protein